MTCGRKQMYPGLMYPQVQNPTTPGQLDMWQNAGIPRLDVPLSFENLVVQNPTTPGQFDMGQHADVPRSDVLPLPESNLVAEPYYTR